jgi:hypothetical protein
MQTFFFGTLFFSRDSNKTTIIATIFTAIIFDKKIIDMVTLIYPAIIRVMI